MKIEYEYKGTKARVTRGDIRGKWHWSWSRKDLISSRSYTNYETEADAMIAVESAIDKNLEFEAKFRKGRSKSCHGLQV